MRRSAILYPLMWLFFSMLVACGEDNAPTPRNYPRLRTLSPVTVPAGVTFTGELFFLPAEGVTDHGFVWSTYQAPVLGISVSRSLGPRTGAGKFSVSTDKDIQKGTVYYVRSYAKSGPYTVYGTETAFRW